MNNEKNLEIARLLKEALKIVDKLAKFDVDDENDFEDLIKQAKRLTKNGLWKLI